MHSSLFHSFCSVQFYSMLTIPAGSLRPNVFCAVHGSFAKARGFRYLISSSHWISMTDLDIFEDL